MTIANLKPGLGREKGSQNKTTRERTEAFRKKLDETNIIFKLIDQIMLDIDDQTVKFKDKLDALKTLLPYTVLNVSSEELTEQIANIQTKEDAERVAQILESKLRIVR
ncbi:hypothetical protein [Herbiconiux daphne]|uniref:Uncharacterized protein n=1 Tax=Herbiconiux daphne TaxID=2970914 RepID=A0ABT2HCI6_9MICO|nr:hypothetical protein [Herbiconiux daphne]MCS5737618.1 hypothetical protein [Herbiconiux daphne]